MITVIIDNVSLRCRMALYLLAGVFLLTAVCLGKIHAEAAPSAITLEIQVDRVFLLPGETQFATVTVSNSATQPTHVPIILTLRWDMAQVREAGRTTLEVPAQGSVKATFAFPSGPGLYGYEARATDPDDPAASAAAFFTVHHNLWQVSMQGDGLAALSGTSWQDAARMRVACGWLWNGKREQAAQCAASIVLSARGAAAFSPHPRSARA